MSEPSKEELWDQRANRYADGEMDPEQAAAFEAELANDPETQARWTAWQQDLAEFGAALEPSTRAPQMTERVLAALANEPLPGAHANAEGTSLNWLWIPLAAAAGFAIAVSSRPAPTQPAPVERIVYKDRMIYKDRLVYMKPPAKKRPIGRLALTNGALQMWSPDTQTWETAMPGTPLFPGSKLRTAHARKAAISLSDGTEIRLNQSSELALVAERSLYLERGEIWSHVARTGNQAAFEIGTRHGNVQVVGTEINLFVDETETRLAVLNGQALLRNKRGRQVEVNARQISRISGERVFDAYSSRRIEQTTNWMVELLYLRGRDNPELARKVNNLLALIGQTKMQHLTEQEIRSLGHTCALPLAKFIRSGSSKLSWSTDGHRVTAARILGDVADHAVLPDLVEMLLDKDAKVRSHAARGFCRLWGISNKRRRESELQLWRSGSDKSRAFRNQQLRQQLRRRHKWLDQRMKKE